VARQLDRHADAQTRIDTALRLLQDATILPADRIEVGDSADIVLRARADHLAETGDPQRAIEAYETLRDKIMASNPAPRVDLSHAVSLSALYEALTALYRRTGVSGKAGALSQLRIELWQHWDRRLPGNDFVRRQIAALHLD
jgi:hypothetical protein